MKKKLTDSLETFKTSCQVQAMFVKRLQYKKFKDYKCFLLRTGRNKILVNKSFSNKISAPPALFFVSTFKSGHPPSKLLFDEDLR